MNEKDMTKKKIMVLVNPDISDESMDEIMDMLNDFYPSDKYYRFIHKDVRDIKIFD